MKGALSFLHEKTPLFPLCPRLYPPLWAFTPPGADVVWKRSISRRVPTYLGTMEGNEKIGPNLYKHWLKVDSTDSYQLINLTCNGHMVGDGTLVLPNYRANKAGTGHAWESDDKADRDWNFQFQRL
jgi:hypothetical protein